MSNLQVTFATILFWAVYLVGHLIAERSFQGRKKRLRSRLFRLFRYGFVLTVAFGCLWVSTSDPRALATYVPGSIFLVTVALWPLARHVLAPLGLVKPA